MGVMTTDSGVRLQMKKIIPASRDRVYQAWTDPKDLMKWWAASPEHSPSVAEFDVRVGGKYRLGMKHDESGDNHVVFGTFKVVDAPNKLVYTWQWEGADAMGGESLVTVEFIDKGNETEIILTHEQFTDEEIAKKHEGGWMGCIGNLESYMTG